jgi:2-polyprenyl-6-methoxyphenol hydroxylase-like FAD-dependent oxidoreductase
MCDVDWYKKATSKERKDFIDKEYPDWKDFMKVKDESKINEIFF